MARNWVVLVRPSQVLVLRNVPQSDFDSDRVKRLLSSLTYLSSHHTFNQERLEVPETELFETLQLHRRYIVRWLVEQRRLNSLTGFNSVLRGCHQQLSALGDTSAPDTSGFEWVCVGDDTEYEGRFGVLSEAAPDKEAQGGATGGVPCSPIQCSSHLCLFHDF